MFVSRKHDAYGLLVCLRFFMLYGVVIHEGYEATLSCWKCMPLL